MLFPVSHSSWVLARQISLSTGETLCPLLNMADIQSLVGLHMLLQKRNNHMEELRIYFQ